MKRRSKTDYSDISFRYLSGPLASVTLVVAFFSAVVLLLGTTVVSGNYDASIEHNQTAQKFNQLSLTERQLITEWSELEVDAGTYLMTLKDDPLRVGEFVPRCLLVAIGVLIVVLSATLFLYYWDEKRSDHFLADLPLGTAYGWFLFFGMFVAWPILIVSALRMWRYFRPQHKAEKAIVEQQAEAELSDEQVYQLAQSPKIRKMRVARQVYVNYRARGMTQTQQKLIEAAEGRVEELKHDIRDYGQKIQRKQRELGEAKAELQNLTTVKISAQATRSQAKTEWKLLSEMRGVANITAQKGRGKRPDKIFILVKVRVPYRNHVYDFGDYRIMLCGTTFECKRVRSGVKVDHTSTYPDYNESRGFCFGSRRETILDYLGQGKIIEAVTLMIDCLHSVNDGVESYIPECFRKVATVERAKRRLRRQAKDKGGKSNG